MSSATAFPWPDIGSSDRVPRFDLYRLPGNEGHVVDVQSDHASGQVATRIVAPLIPVAELDALISDLNPVVAIDGSDHAFLAQSLATLTRAELGAPVANLDRHHDAFVRALDIALTGF